MRLLPSGPRPVERDADVHQVITGEDRVLPGMRELVATRAERPALYSELDTPNGASACSGE